jgi:cobalt/nickel transport protein
MESQGSEFRSICHFKIKDNIMTITKKLWIGIGILALLSPLGLIIPALFGAGGAWGEWGIDAIKNIVGFVPEGMKRLADTGNAPLTGYAVPGQSRGLVNESFGYIISAFIGIALAAAIMFLIAKLLVRKKNGD